jgi:hypothetical protein
MRIIQSKTAVLKVCLWLPCPQPYVQGYRLVRWYEASEENPKVVTEMEEMDSGGRTKMGNGMIDEARYSMEESLRKVLIDKFITPTGLQFGSRSPSP